RKNYKQKGEFLDKWVRRTEVRFEQLMEWSLEFKQEAARFSPGVVEQVVLEAKYAGYIDRQAAQVERFHRLESKPIPPTFDYAAVPQLRHEAKEKFQEI